ncbi:hypothetical protein JHW43_002561 [Diplocarpon mali]|nr:hypothetical protein JHW43_002561 [Diplocarpon mali]
MRGLTTVPAESGASGGEGQGQAHRPGWDEERCRRYIVRNLSWVPRNFEYEDGLRLIHAELETAFGDENGDLSIGVLEELIELDGVNPFPESLFQRWKHHHRHRHDDLQLPHVPHTRTIQGPIIPTERLRLSRLKSGKQEKPALSASASNWKALSGVAPVAGHWEVENAWYVSTKEGHTRILSLPTPIEHAERLSDPGYGRGGKVLGARFHPLDKIAIQAAHEQVKNTKVLCPDCIVDLFKRLGRKDEAHPPTAVNSSTAPLQEQGLEKNLGRLLKTMLQNESATSFDFKEHLQKMHWPDEVEIPNANFARKYALVPRGEALPTSILKGLRQSSVDEEDLKILRQLWESAREEYESLEVEGEPGADSTADQKLFELYLSHYFSPLTPVLFFDSGLDFDWESNGEGKIPSNRDTEATLVEEVGVRGESSHPEKRSATSTEGNEEWHVILMGCRVPVSPGTDSTAIPELNHALRRAQEFSAGVESVGTRDANQITVFSLDKNNPPAAFAHKPAIRRTPSSTSVDRASLSRVSLGQARDRPRAWSMAFDGRSGDLRDFDRLFPRRALTDQAPMVNNSSQVNNRKRSSTFLSQRYLTDLDFVPPQVQAHTKPLHTRKASGQIRVAQSRQDLGFNTHLFPSSSPIYPPRRSSIKNFNELSASPSRAREHTHRRQNSDTLSAALRCPTSSYSTTHASPSINTTRSTTSSHPQRYIPDSTGIIGDFVPIEPTEMASAHYTSASKGSMHSNNKPSKIPRPNPYQFEPDTPWVNNEQRQTQFSDFLDNQDASRNSAPTPSPRVGGHTKNARSAGNDLFFHRENEQLSPPKPGFTLHRSESSPSLMAAHFEAPSRRIPSPDIHTYYSEDTGQSSLPRRGRSPSPSRSNYKYEEPRASSSYYQTSQTYSTPSRLGSPVRHGSNAKGPVYHSTFGRYSPAHRESSSREHAYHSNSGRISPTRRESDSKDSSHHASASGRHSGKTPSETLHDVVERDEQDDFFDQELPLRFRSESPTKSPQKRSRSPMKKMFGENGWLGRSPDEISEVKRQVKKAAAEQKDRPSMMGKLRSKLGEFAEKADISPGRSGRSNNDKRPKISILSVSLGPPEQARLLMEVELMIVHTANTFLMNQFSQGRIAVDSIKKTVDTWKSKGRHVVIEFMYDQATQRDLVAANQHNFRFFGERAGNDVRTNSMLYNWKQVASLMSIRTFCEADTVILKLLFDVEQILELLGGAEAIMLRLQQIRAGANEMMRIARQKKEARKSAQIRNAVPATPGRAATWLSQSSAGASAEDPYGGVKHVPDSYKHEQSG